MAKQAQIDAVRPALTAIDKEVAAAEKVIDTVAEVVPEAFDKGVDVTAEVARRGVRAFRDPRKVVIILGISGAILGAGVGVFVYRIARKRLEKEFENRLDAEIESMRSFYIQRYKAEKYATPQSAAEALGANTEDESEAVEEAVEALETYQGKAPVEYDKVKIVTDTVLKGVSITQDGTGVEVQDKEITVQRNVFVDGRPIVLEDWDAEAEEANRNPEVPYVISHDEFMENSFEHEQSTLTYYVGDGDDILAESDDSIINEVESIVGNDNLNRFGHGSRDPNVVYIRNERTEADYEVVRHTGSYAETVHGLRHSEEHAHRRSRWGDDE